ncbi:MAG: NUDIX domain-containing protein [Minisyncoccia bacterium]
MKNEILEFGIKRENEERRDGGCGVVFDPKTQKYAAGIKPNGLLILFAGGVDKEEDVQEGTMREVTEESGLYDFLYIEKIGEGLSHFYNSAKNVNRVAHFTCFLAVLKSANLVPTKLEEHENFTLTWVSAQEFISNWEERNQNKDYEHWIYFFKKAVNRAKELGYDAVS